MAKVSLRAYNREIEAMIDRGQLEEAIAHCRHILGTFPKHLETYRLLGKAYLESKRFGDAADIFSRVLVTVPNDFVAQVGMSIIRDEENKLEEAIWHMERAFETQPSNPAVQGELQRLYARRDGVRPPRIRMTRGALANMYVQGELYPQAISEIKNVLKDDPERADMQALLARACYQNGLKNEAADMATSLLRRYPYSFDANRVMVEILGSEHPETAQMYRQRVLELDPYAALVTGSIFLSSQVSDAAVNIERLDWDGQPVPMQPDWGDAMAISLASGQREEQPDWLSKPADETSLFGSTSSAPESLFASPPPPEPPPAVGGIAIAATSVFGSESSGGEQPSEQAEDEIPDFMRAAGWGKSTGQFDESQSVFGEQESKPAEPIEQGDLPEWVRAMKPPEPAAPQQADEDLPDWIKAIGAGAIASQAADHIDWLGDDETPSDASPEEQKTDWPGPSEGAAAAAFVAGSASDQDWLKETGEPESGSTLGSTEEPDWLKGLGLSEEVSSAAPAEEPDWLKGLGETQPASARPEEPDWLKGLSASESEEPALEPEQSDWLKSLGEAESAPAQAQADELDWLRDLGETKPEQAEAEETSSWLRNLGEPSAVSSSDQDDDKADWLKGAAIVGGIAGLSSLGRDEEPSEPAETTIPGSSDQLSEEPVLESPFVPESSNAERLGMSEQEQDDSFAWLESLAAKQGATEGLLTTPDERLEEEPDWVKQAKGLQKETPPAQPTASLEELGKSAQEQDDSFAWLESLAAKQGATEGLLTTPDERLEEEPDWVKQAKGLQKETPPAQPTASLEELGKSAQEQDDSFAWLESLAAKQGATEGLLTTPDERLEQEPEWVRQAKDLSAPEIVAAAALGAEVVEHASREEPEPVADDEVDTWLKNLEGTEAASEPATAAADETAIWLKGLPQQEAPSADAEEFKQPDLPEWMNTVQVGPEETPTSVFAEEAELGSTWMPPAEETAPVPEASVEEDALPSWLSELEKENVQQPTATPSSADDLPAWLLEEETAPATTEPASFADWRPTEETREQPAFEDQFAEEQQPVLDTVPPVSLDMPEAETVLDAVQPEVEPEQVPVMSAPERLPESEPFSAQAAGGLAIPAVDPVLASARSELSGNNVPGALNSYDRLIKKARYLDEVIYDLREATYRYPVDVNIWQSLGDAYLRANRLQDALDAYTKAEELLR